MRLAETVALSAVFLILAIALTSGRALSEPNERARALAAEASSENAIKRLQSEDERKLEEASRVKLAQAKKDELLRRCRVKPVMTDGEIEACRVAYRDLGATTN